MCDSITSSSARLLLLNIKGSVAWGRSQLARRITRHASHRVASSGGSKDGLDLVRGAFLPQTSTTVTAIDGRGHGCQPLQHSREKLPVDVCLCMYCIWSLQLGTHTCCVYLLCRQLYVKRACACTCCPRDFSGLTSRCAGQPDRTYRYTPLYFERRILVRQPSSVRSRNQKCRALGGAKCTCRPASLSAGSPSAEVSSNF